VKITPVKSTKSWGSGVIRFRRVPVKAHIERREESLTQSCKDQELGYNPKTKRVGHNAVRESLSADQTGKRTREALELYQKSEYHTTGRGVRG
jgi:hypothetical protein